MIQVSIAMILWGTIGMFTLWSNMSMVDVTFYRCLLAVIPLGVFCYFRTEHKLDWWNARTMALVILSSVLLVANWLFLFWSFELSSITLGNVSYYLQPIFLVILGMVFFRDKVSIKQWGFILISFLGVLMTAGLFSGKISLDGGNITIGLICAIIAGILYAFVTIIAKPLKGIPASQLVIWQLSLGAIVLLPFLEEPLTPLNDSNKFACIFIIGVVHTALAYVLYYQGIKKISITMIAVLSYLDPVVAVFTDIIFFNHKLDSIQIIGIIFTFIGSYLVVKPYKVNSSKVINNPQKNEYTAN